MYNGIYEFKNTTDKERIYQYWYDHNKSGLPLCWIIENYLITNNSFNFCEIGCQLAGLSDLVLHEFENSNVYSIDITNHNPSVITNLQNKFPNRFKFMLESSLESYENFEDGFFDIIYIDTDPHKYDQLKKEIELWFPKVKNNGILSFHDYDHICHPDVTVCLDEYCNDHNFELIKTEYHNVFFVKK